MHCFSTYFTHAQCPNLWKRSGSKCYAVHRSGTHIPYPVVTFVFTVLRHELLGRILSHAQACDNVRVPSATQCTASVHIQYFTHAQTCDKVRVPSVKQCTTSVHSLYTCSNLWLRSCSKCYARRCFATLHKPISCDNVPVQSAQQCTASVHAQYFTHAQTCDNVRVQSATQCTVSVNIILDTCPNLLFVCFFGANLFCICGAKDFCIHHTAVASQGNPETQSVYHVRSNALGQRCMSRMLDLRGRNVSYCHCAFAAGLAKRSARCP